MIRICLCKSSCDLIDKLDTVKRCSPYMLILLRLLRIVVITICMPMLMFFFLHAFHYFLVNNLDMIHHSQRCYIFAFCRF